MDGQEGRTETTAVDGWFSLSAFSSESKISIVMGRGGHRSTRTPWRQPLFLAAVLLASARLAPGRRYSKEASVPLGRLFEGGLRAAVFEGGLREAPGRRYSKEAASARLAPGRWPPRQGGGGSPDDSPPQQCAGAADGRFTSTCGSRWRERRRGGAPPACRDDVAGRGPANKARFDPLLPYYWQAGVEAAWLERGGPASWGAHRLRVATRPPAGAPPEPADAAGRRPQATGRRGSTGSGSGPSPAALRTRARDAASRTQGALCKREPGLRRPAALQALGTQHFAPGARKHEP